MTRRQGSRRAGCRGAGVSRAVRAAAAVLAAASLLTGCSAFRDTVPACGVPLRLAIIAQSVPGASYLPCIRELPQGWRASGFDVHRGGTSFRLSSDRSPGAPVSVRLSARCPAGGGTVAPSRAPGVLSYTRLVSIRPRFAGTLLDIFPGGCVSYAFSFALGPHIALMEQLKSAVGLYSRQQLRLVLRHELGVEPGP